MFSTEFQYSLTILKANDGTYGFYYHEKDQEQKLIITNNSTDADALPVVDSNGNVTVPENGNVTIKSESVKEDGSITLDWAELM